MKSPGRQRSVEQTILDTFPSILQWRELMPLSSKPQPGTDLALDDEDWPYFPPSTVAWTGLGSATDHLDAIRRHINIGSMFPIADLTLCRSALIGAAQAVWTLAPDDKPTRLLRVRTVLAYTYKNHLQYLNGLQELDGPSQIGTDHVAETVKVRKEQLAAKRKADNQTKDLDTTLMIRQAAQATFPQQLELADEAVLAWRSSSGAAHGLAWPLLGTSGTIQTQLAGADGMGLYLAGGSLKRIANVYLAAFHLANRGWRLIRSRGVALPDAESPPKRHL